MRVDAFSVMIFKGIEELTKTWNKTVVDRREDLTNWVELFRQFVSGNLKVNSRDGKRAVYTPLA